MNALFFCKFRYFREDDYLPGNKGLVNKMTVPLLQHLAKESRRSYAPRRGKTTEWMCQKHYLVSNWSDWDRVGNFAKLNYKITLRNNLNKTRKRFQFRIEFFSLM